MNSVRYPVVLFSIFLLFASSCGLFGSGEKEISEAQRQQALSHYESAIEYGNAGNLEAAVIQLDQAILLNPGLTEAYIARGRARADLDRYPEAIEDYNVAIEMDPDDPLIYIDRAVALLPDFRVQDGLGRLRQDRRAWRRQL